MDFTVGQEVKFKHWDYDIVIRGTIDCITENAIWIVSDRDHFGFSGVRDFCVDTTTLMSGILRAKAHPDTCIEVKGALYGSSDFKFTCYDISACKVAQNLLGDIFELRETGGCPSHCTWLGKCKSKRSFENATTSIQEET